VFTPGISSMNATYQAPDLRMMAVNSCLIMA